MAHSSTTEPPTDEVPVLALPVLPGYELEVAIGRGGFADVYRGRQTALDRPVAIKVIDAGDRGDPKLFSRVRTEALTLGRFQHPNIVPVYDYARLEGKVFIVMELLVGEDLNRRLSRAGKVDEGTAWQIARQAAAGLAHAAAHGVVHRDIKPANLFLLPAPAGIALPPGVPLVKVTDFGLARARWAVDGGSSQMTARGSTLGTPAYMAPEQHGGSGDVDHRADIYALGATVYHMLAGRPPFTGTTVWELIARKQAGAPPLPGVSPESAELVADLMATAPADRPLGYDELLARIDRLPCVAGTAVLPHFTFRRRKRRRWHLPAAVLLGAVAAGGWAAWPKGPAQKGFLAAEPPMPLFSGKGLDRWNSEGGEWLLATDDEKLRVLQGSGRARLKLPPYTDFQLSLGLDSRNGPAEVRVGRDGGPLYAVRVESGSATFGVRAKPDAALRPLGPAAASKPRPGGRPYLEVKLERSGGEWTAWFDGTLLGSIADPTRPDPAAWLLTEGGPVRLDTAEITPLLPAP